MNFCKKNTAIVSWIYYAIKFKQSFVVCNAVVGILKFNKDYACNKIHITHLVRWCNLTLGGIANFIIWPSLWTVLFGIINPYFISPATKNIKCGIKKGLFICIAAYLPPNIWVMRFSGVCVAKCHPGISIVIRRGENVTTTLKYNIGETLKAACQLKIEI